MRVLFLCLACISFSLKVVAQSELWGMTSLGGKDYLGTIFKTKTDGSDPILQYSFSTPFPGGNPGYGHLVEGLNGKLYGLTIVGGRNGKGVLYEFDPSTNSYLVKHDFDGANGANPQSSMVLHPNGKFYGLTGSGGTLGYGVLFEFDPASNSFIKKIDFDYNTIGGYPSGGLTLATNNKFYATCFGGGANGIGTLFEYDPVGNVITNKIDFDGINGASPINANLIQSANGFLYGLASLGGTSNDGVLFSYDLSTGTFLKMIDFTGTNGSQPEGGLIELNGFLYGTTHAGGANDQGSIFKYDEINNVVFNTHNFLTTVDASGPTSGMIKASNGKFYGLVPYSGGVNNINGILYEYDPADDSFVKRSSSFDSGYGPIGELVESSGKLYGTTFWGGLNDYGVLFEYDLTTEITTKKIDFNYAPDGTNPIAELTQHPNGKLYGMTGSGGSNGKGVLFEFDPLTKTFVKKFDFGGPNGENPRGSVVLSSNGKLYGCTISGGSQNLGILFEFDPSSSSWVKKIDFDGSVGTVPTGGLTLLSSGHFIGTTFAGGANSVGVIFDFDPITGIITKKNDFDQATTGGGPVGSLTQAINGNFFGITQQGGANGLGTVYELDTSNYSVSKVIDLDNSNANAKGKLVQHPNGKLYGTTTQGGNGAGIIFEIDPVSHSYEFKFGFSYNIPDDIGGPPENLTLSPVDNKLYGVTNTKSGNGNGALFSFDPNGSTYTTIFDFVDSIGVSPQCGLIVFNEKNQFITFNTLTPKTFGDPPFDLYATSTSGLPVTFTSSDPAIVSINGYTVNVLKAGTVIITAHQNGDALINPAADVQQTLLINKGNQSILFDSLVNNALPPKTFGDPPFNLYATATSQLPVTFTSSDPTIASIFGNQVTILGAGTITITAHQIGDDNINPAPDAQQTLVIKKANQSILFNSLTDKVFGDPTFSISSSASSGLTVVYSSSNNKVVINGDLVSIIASGREVINASQQGDNNYNAAATASQSFCIHPPKPTVSLENATSATPLLTSSATIGNQWYLNGEVIPGASTPTLTASQSGDYSVQITVDDCTSEFSEITSLVITGDINVVERIALFPTPAKDYLFIKGLSDEVRICTAINLVGSQLSLPLSKELELQKVDIHNLSPGIYVLQIVDQGIFHTLKFVKQ